jgi:hypothetical protein
MNAAHHRKARSSPDWSAGAPGRSFSLVSQVAVNPDTSVVLRSRADMAMRRLLFVPAGPSTVGDDAVHRMFSFSIVLSALRCLLSYVVFPIVTPALGLATGVGPAIGIPIAVLALTFDVVGIRRFWVNDHRWRWAMTAIYAAVMVLVGALLVGDIAHLAS